MFYDPIQKLIDYQLRSRCGRFEELLILGGFPQVDVISGTTEDMMIEAIDRKWFSDWLWEERKFRVVELYREGWTEMDIAVREGVSHQAVSKILKKM